jgi:hypothetical protein
VQFYAHFLLTLLRMRGTTRHILRRNHKKQVPGPKIILSTQGTIRLPRHYANVTGR